MHNKRSKGESRAVSRQREHHRLHKLQRVCLPSSNWIVLPLRLSCAAFASEPLCMVQWPLHPRATLRTQRRSPPKCARRGAKLLACAGRSCAGRSCTGRSRAAAALGQGRLSPQHGSPCIDGLRRGSRCPHCHTKQVADRQGCLKPYPCPLARSKSAAPTAVDCDWQVPSWTCCSIMWIAYATKALNSSTVHSGSLRLSLRGCCSSKATSNRSHSTGSSSSEASKSLGSRK
mmetsp:Transcript_48203/g.111730  ORF Transcript_48203/g.111730 Transcript_48203/m.111730 type:complete len:231 (+) Transcript_48203:304-996(+)